MDARAIGVLFEDRQTPLAVGSRVIFIERCPQKITELKKPLRQRVFRMLTRRATIQEIADECGVDHRTVRRALARADMKAGRGGYDYEVAVAAVNTIADPARINGHAVTRANAGNGGVESPMIAARVTHERLKARRLEIENAKAEGELINRNAYTETGVSVIVAARTALLTLGHRCAEKVAGKTDVKEISRLIESEVRIVLGALAEPETFLAAVEAEALT